MLAKFEFGAIYLNVHATKNIPLIVKDGHILKKVLCYT